MDERGNPADRQSRAFHRSVLDVRSAFHDWFAGLVVDGRVKDKEKLEQDKLKITARLVNLVVAGGMLLFREAGDPHAHAEHPFDSGEARLDEDTFFRMLRGTIVTMLGELNAADVNLLKVSLSARFRKRLQEVFTVGAARPDRFPVKVVQDIHPDHSVFIGINLRDTRSLGEDISRIELDPELRNEITSSLRPSRHSDSNFGRIFSGADSR